MCEFVFDCHTFVVSVSVPSVPSDSLFIPYSNTHDSFVLFASFTMLRRKQLARSLFVLGPEATYSKRPRMKMLLNG